MCRQLATVSGKCGVNLWAVCSPPERYTHSSGENIKMVTPTAAIHGHGVGRFLAAVATVSRSRRARVERRSELAGGPNP